MEKEMYREVLPNVELEFDSYTRACILLDETKDLELVMKFHFEELISKYNLRRNRLEQYRLKFLTNKEKTHAFHQQLRNIYFFLHHYSYLSLDTKTLDMRGRNIINYALTQSEPPTVEFIIHYLAMGNTKTVTAEMNELFSVVNKVDGLNALVPFIKTFGKVDLLIKYKISMNHKMMNGSTLAHYLCNYGKKSLLVSIENSLKDLPPKERIYFFDLSLKNEKNETPLDVCLREENETIYHHLMNSTIFKQPSSSLCVVL
ncbi:predicted protein [Naegleria gruberi]|uniref:Predicted protein n=1 Tax=Naegleria gruberi TaxID=5762 RepID=D2VMN7_NAEGR|nr:uncharacterized protein NAEGRDRAFT_50816 [Naegleria gruberi]EFC41863.1 predicted protein [Naegleria gruberi]|eukprot:XP_002674607.1 predicted protein [Naegleria gruberi strain NEG-M]